MNNTQPLKRCVFLFAGVAVFFLALVMCWRPLFLDHQVPVDGNMMRMAYPNWVMTRQFKTSQTAPLWNPFRNMGEPFLADPQTMAAYPVRWLLPTRLPFLSYMQFWVLFHSSLAVLFMALIAWRWTQDPWATAMAGMVAGLNGFFTSHVSLPNHFAAAAYLPAILYFTDQKRPIQLGMAIALQWCAGFPPFFILSGIMSLAIAAFQGYPALRAWLCGSVMGLLLAAVQVVPFVEFFAHSVRPVALAAAGATAYSEPLLQLFKIWGVPQWYALAPKVIGDQAIVASYAGLVTLGLAVFGMIRNVKRTRGLSWLLLASLCLSLGSALPGYAYLPFTRLFRFPANWNLIAMGSVALLAAVGVANLPGRVWKITACLCVLADLVAFAQFIRVPWLDPQLLETAPALALRQSASPYPVRIYHPQRVTDFFAQQNWHTMDDYFFMKEILIPSYGTALGVREASSYQVLRLTLADTFQHRLSQEGPGSPLARWAGIANVIALKRGADHVGRDTLGVLSVANPERPVFIVRPARGDRVDSLEYKPGHVTAAVHCASPFCQVVCSDVDYPGWKASLDERPTPLNRFEDIFISIHVPQGSHVVVFRFDSLAYRWGRIITFITLSLMLGFLLWR